MFGLPHPRCTGWVGLGGATDHGWILPIDGRIAFAADLDYRSSPSTGS